MQPEKLLHGEDFKSAVVRKFNALVDYINNPMRITAGSGININRYPGGMVISSDPRIGASPAQAGNNRYDGPFACKIKTNIITDERGIDASGGYFYTGNYKQSVQRQWFPLAAGVVWLVFSSDEGARLMFGDDSEPLADPEDNTPILYSRRIAVVEYDSELDDYVLNQIHTSGDIEHVGSYFYLGDFACWRVKDESGFKVKCSGGRIIAGGDILNVDPVIFAEKDGSIYIACELDRDLHTISAQLVVSESLPAGYDYRLEIAALNRDGVIQVWTYGTYELVGYWL